MAPQFTFAQWIHTHPHQNHAQQAASYHAYVVQSSKNPITSGPFAGAAKSGGLYTSDEVNNFIKAHFKTPAAQQQALANMSRDTPAQVLAVLKHGAPVTTAYVNAQKPKLPPNPYQAQIDTLRQEQNVLPSEYNAQRQQDANLAAQGLVAGGYYDAKPGSESTSGMGITPSTSMPSSGTAQHGTDVVYTLQPGPDGRLYRQAFQKVAHSAVSRGAGSSFDANYQMNQDQQALDIQRTAMMQKAAAAQTTSVGKEKSIADSLGNQITSDIGKYQTSGTKAIATDPTATAPPSGQGTTRTTTTTSKPTFASFLSAHKGTTIKMPRLQQIYKERYGS